MQWDRERSNTLYKGLQKLKKELEMETIQDTDAYAVGFRAWEISKIVLAVTGGLVLCGLFVLVEVPNYALIVFLLVTGYSVLVLFLFFRYNPRLNKQGQILREEWLGFKLYLRDYFWSGEKVGEGF
jgi:Flp pilus assembly protein TadB